MEEAQKQLQQLLDNIMGKYPIIWSIMYHEEAGHAMIWMDIATQPFTAYPERGIPNEILKAFEGDRGEGS